MKQLAWRIRYIRIAYCDGIPLICAVTLSKLDWNTHGKLGILPQQRWNHYK